MSSPVQSTVSRQLLGLSLYIEKPPTWFSYVLPLTSAQLFICDEDTNLSQTICYVKIQREVIVYYIPMFIAYSRT